MHTPQRTMKFQNFYFDPQLIARDDAPPKPHFVQSRQHEQTGRVAADFVEREDCRRLRQRFHDQHPRHHRMPREMPGEVRLVEGEVFDRYDAALGPVAEAIDEQERIARGQQPQYTLELGDFGFVVVRHRELLHAPWSSADYFEMVDFLAASSPNSDGCDAPGSSASALSRAAAP